MANTFQLEIITPAKTVYSEQVDMVIARAIDGELGVMAGHAPVITALTISVLTIKKDGDSQEVAIHGGFMDVHPDKVTILTTTAERTQDIDYDRAVAAKERAEQRLSASSADIDVARAELALKRALARIQTYNAKQ